MTSTLPAWRAGPPLADPLPALRALERLWASAEYRANIAEALGRCIRPSMLYVGRAVGFEDHAIWVSYFIDFARRQICVASIDALELS